MEGYLKKTHRKLLKIRERYTLMKTVKEIAPVFAWATVTIGFALITFWGYAVNRLSKMGILFLALSPACWAFSLLLKKLVERKNREITKEISAFAGEDAAEEFLVRKFSRLMQLMDYFETESGKQVPKNYEDEAFFKRMKHFWETEAPEIAETDILERKRRVEERKRKAEERKLNEENLIKNFNDKYSGSFLESGKDEHEKF